MFGESWLTVGHSPVTLIFIMFVELKSCEVHGYYGNFIRSIIVLNCTKSISGKVKSSPAKVCWLGANKEKSIASTWK